MIFENPTVGYKFIHFLHNTKLEMDVLRSGCMTRALNSRGPRLKSATFHIISLVIRINTKSRSIRYKHSFYQAQTIKILTFCVAH